MFKAIDAFLNTITMYRLVLYYLMVLFVVSFVFSALGWLPFAPLMLVFSAVWIVALCAVLNALLAWVFRAPANIESLYITAFILVLIIPPPTSFTDTAFLAFGFWAAVWAMASKFLLAVHKKHVFNPAAFGVAITAFTIDQSASWWVGSRVLLPVVLLGGWLIVRKIRRADLAWSFFLFALGSVVVFGLLRGSSPLTLIQRSLLDSPIVFFTFVMITEPLTTPPTRSLRIAYGALVGALFAPAVHIGAIYSTPELALLVGNVFSYAVSPKKKLLLSLKEKVAVADGVYDFVFTPDEKMAFQPGQYLEWTLGHAHPDQRGNRRYFTIASSPTEREIRMGVKFYPKPSTFKQRLLAFEKGDRIVASQLAGDFTLPKDPTQPLVFIAGGIGVTPFRSMIKYLVDRKERRDITLFYCAKTTNDLAYMDIFKAAEPLGVKTVCVIADPGTSADWQGEAGFLDATKIKKYVNNVPGHLYFISGPHVMVTTFDGVLKAMGVPDHQIKKDFFPGFV